MITTLTGENAFELEQGLHKIIADFIEQFGDLSLERLDGQDSDFAKISEALTSLPFLSARKLVIFKNSSANRDFIDKFESLLADLPSTTDLVIADPKLDKRTLFYKYLKKTVDFREFNPLSTPRLVDWLVGRAEQLGGKLSSDSARYLIDRAGPDQLQLAHEIDKLFSFSADITRANIDKLVAASPSSKIFDLMDSAFAGNREKALKLYAQQRAQRVEPQQIIAMLAWQLHILALVKTATGLSSSQIARQAKQNPFVIEKSAALAKKIELSSLVRHIRELLDLDVRSKTTNINLDSALNDYLVAL